MLHEPVHEPALEEATSTPIPWPPLSGPGSDTAAWVAFAREVAQGSEEAREVVEEQAARIASLEAEVARLRARLAEPEAAEAQPDAPGLSTPELGKLAPVNGERADNRLGGGRRKTSEDTRTAILADLAAGLSQSQAARRHGVSAMTVSRLARSA